MRKILPILWIITLHIYAGQSYTNALIKEDSPYLQQHAHNPVDWYPWGEEAFAKAKRENKLIFLSIGYSTCHWCHVMEEESFVDVEVAKLLNRDYISIKVDREQYPQIDRKYQEIYSILKRRGGGWPLTLIMTPDRLPVYLATYLPKEDGYGVEGMLNLLPHYATLYHADPKRVVAQAIEYKRRYQERSQLPKESIHYNKKLLDTIVQQIAVDFDKTNGGFAKRPKFPEASKIALLLDIYTIDGDREALYMAQKTLTKMAEGGIYDQVEGGFFRYTTDREWQIPHFEKMLYTNAELIPLYVKLYQIDPNPLYKRVVAETIAQMDRYFNCEGLYCSASDADSDGVEGGYFIYDYRAVVAGLKKRRWKPQEIETALGYMGIEEDGNIDGEFSHAHITAHTKPPKLQKLKAYLTTLRKSRKFPFVDHKIITSWNAMMIKALFEASKIDADYKKVAEAKLKRVLALLSKGDMLYHQTLAGSQPKQLGMLEDYAFVIDALLSAHQATLDTNYLTLAQKFTQKAIQRFYRNQKWYLSDDEVETLAGVDDDLYSSPLGVILNNLDTLALLQEDSHLHALATKTFENYGKYINTLPSAIPGFMRAVLQERVGAIVIQSSRSNLQANKANRAKISKIKYPFILRKAIESDRYMACKMESCFADSQSLDGLLSAIERSSKESDTPKRWR